MEALLNSGITELVISLEFAKKNKFKKLDKLIYMRNVNSIFNHKGPIEHIVKMKSFYKKHKERIEINIIER